MLCLQHQGLEKHVHSNSSKVKIASTTDSLLTIKTMNVAFKILSVPQYERTILYFNSYIHKKQLTEPAGNMFDLPIQHSHLPLGLSLTTLTWKVTPSIFFVWAEKSSQHFAWDKGPFSVQSDPKAEQLQTCFKSLTYLQSLSSHHH